MNRLQKTSLKQQIYRLLAPIFVILAADFNKEFKDTLDLAMYNHVIQPRGEHSADDLPMEELDKAEDVLHRLENATSLQDNLWRIRSMLYMCQNLRMYMTEIAETESYDLRMQMLEKNIRGETGLTTLIEEYMHNFIDDEVQELARLRDNLGRQSTILIASAVVIMLILYMVIILYSMRISSRITTPIIDLTKKAQSFGAKGMQESKPIKTNVEELQILDETFDEMTDHITTLMNKQIDNERSLHRTELELLQAQINPHFLYNTLDSIVVLAESDREEDVVDMITSLSTFFRNSLSEGEDVHTLRAELAQAASYLEIQQIRYSDILDYSIDVSEEIQDCLIPKLVLQPLIENALYHGIKNRRGRGLITITGNREEDQILLRVSDNGAGMDAEQLRQLQQGIYQEKQGSFGLWNVHQRILLYCGESYGLTFESAPGEGTTVNVSLPPDGVTTK